MNRYFLILSYNGTNYQGWQAQPGKHTVQGEVHNALQLVLKESLILTGAGRTDSGVHAINYTAHFDSENLETGKIPDIIHKLNRFLHNDIIIHNVIPVHDEAHARYDAVSRTYHYLISLTKNPFLDSFSLHYPRKLDLLPMNQACEILKANRDFASFSKMNSNNKTTICEVREAEWREINPDLVVFRISADRFLRNMVRAITGTMLKVGTNYIPVNALNEIIDKKNRKAAGTSVKAKGLFLTEIKYPYLSVPENKNHLLNESFFF